MHGGDDCRDGRSDADALSLFNLDDFSILSALGRGAKGVVFLIQVVGSGRLLALKAVLRAPVEGRNVATVSSAGDDYDKCGRIWFEKELLESFCHPLLPKLHGILVTDRITAYAIDYCPGRDLNCLRKKQTEEMFSDDIIRFYAAELVLGLEYLHGLGVVYRDLKPENIMIQENGHLMLVDFDLSAKLSAKSPQISHPLFNSPPPQPPRTMQPMRKTKKTRCCIPFFKRRDTGISPEYSVHVEVNSTVTDTDFVEKSNSFVGTEEYVAPEIILGNGHDFAVDWWCLGVVLYELLYGTTPFRGSDRKDTFRRIVNRPPDLTGELTPLRDLIGKLLEKDPKKRISNGGIKCHNFFKSVDWDSITELPRPPFIPELPEVEGTIGNNKIDLESYVEQVLAVKEGKTEKKNKGCDENSNFLVF